MECEAADAFLFSTSSKESSYFHTFSHASLNVDICHFLEASNVKTKFEALGTNAIFFLQYSLSRIPNSYHTGNVKTSARQTTTPQLNDSLSLSPDKGPVMNSSDEIFTHPWSPKCYNNISKISTDSGNDDGTWMIKIVFGSPYKNVSKVCEKGSKGYLYEDIDDEEIPIRATVLQVLLFIMFFGGFLAILSNSVVLFFGIRTKGLFKPEVMSLAVTDLLTGLLGTPTVMAIYFFSEYIGGNYFYRTRVRSLFTLVTNSLSHSCLVNLIDVTLACEDANLKLVEVVTVAHVDAEDHVGNSLLQIWEVTFGPKAKLLFRL